MISSTTLTGAIPVEESETIFQVMAWRKILGAAMCVPAATLPIAYAGLQRGGVWEALGFIVGLAGMLLFAQMLQGAYALIERRYQAARSIVRVARHLGSVAMAIAVAGTVLAVLAATLDCYGASCSTGSAPTQPVACAWGWAALCCIVLRVLTADALCHLCLAEDIFDA